MKTVKCLRAFLSLALLLSGSAVYGQAFRVGKGVQITSNATSVVPSGKAGIWNNSSDGLPYWRKTDGSDVAMTSSGTVYYQTMQGNGSSVTQRSTMNFSSNFAVTDSASKTQVDIGSAVVTLTGSQALSNKTLTAPVLSGSATGTYTLAGTPTITSPTISGPTLSGSVIGTYTIAGVPTYTLSGALAIGTAQTVYVTYANTTAAANNAQQYSPEIKLSGQGWRSGNSTNHSYAMGVQVRPYQGSGADPTGDMVFYESVDGAADAEFFSIRRSRLVNGDGTGVQLVTPAFRRGFEMADNSNNVGIVIADTKVVYASLTTWSPAANNTYTNGGDGQDWSQTWSYRYATEQKNVTFSATPTFDPANGDFQTITMTANITGWTFSAGLEGEVVTIAFIQDGTGSRTLAGTPSNVLLAGGALTLTTTASKRDQITFRYDATLTKWVEQARSLNL